MKLNASFELSARIAAGLRSGEMVRRGGVVQYAAGSEQRGRIVAWLRETSPGPISTHAGNSQVMQSLQLVSGVASVLNLGATLAFGVATLSKLGYLERKVDESTARIIEKLDIAFRQLERGFDNLAQSIAKFEQRTDNQFYNQNFSALSSAARHLSATVPSASGTKRELRLEEMLSKVSSAYDWLATDATVRADTLSQKFGALVGGRDKLAVAGDDLVTMYRLRVTCSAAALEARVLAETGQPREAAEFLRSQANRLHGILKVIGAGLFAQGGLVYDELLHAYWGSRGIGPARVGRWAERFDPDRGGLAGVIELIQQTGKDARPIDVSLGGMRNHITFMRSDSHGWIAGRHDGKPREGFSIPPWSRDPLLSEVVRPVLEVVFVTDDSPNTRKHQSTLDAVMKAISKASTSSVTGVHDVVQWSEDAKAHLPDFLDALDGTWEDIDRLLGHAAEYDAMSEYRLSAADYAARFCLDNCPEGANVAIFVDEASNHQLAAQQ